MQKQMHRFKRDPEVEREAGWSVTWTTLILLVNLFAFAIDWQQWWNQCVFHVDYNDILKMLKQNNKNGLCKKLDSPKSMAWAQRPLQCAHLASDGVFYSGCDAEFRTSLASRHGWISPAITLLFLLFQSHRGVSHKQRNIVSFRTRAGWCCCIDHFHSQRDAFDR